MQFTPLITYRLSFILDNARNGHDNPEIYCLVLRETSSMTDTLQCRGLLVPSAGARDRDGGLKARGPGTEGVE